MHCEHVTKSLRSARLLEYDWDGSGGLPLRSDVADTALAIYEEDGALGELDSHLPVPTVTINNNGTAEFSYQNEGRELLVTVQCDGVVTYIKLYEDEQTSVEGTIRLNADIVQGFCQGDFVELTELFNWLAWG